MSGARAERIEAIVERLAATLFAAAVAYASFVMTPGIYAQAQIGVFSAIAGVAAYLLCARVLRSIAPETRRFEVTPFEVAPIEDSQMHELLLTDQVELLLTDQVELVLTDADRLGPDELILTEADRVRPGAASDPDELVLDDILAELEPDSRVVRLFDRAAMPTPGQLNARIERHLGEASQAGAPPDASQALYDALAELRRSLR